jgi:hypothetical protein
VRVWFATVTTEASDRYYYAFRSKPDKKKLIRRVWEQEGRVESLQFYLDTTGVRVVEVEVE